MDANDGAPPSEQTNVPLHHDGDQEPDQLTEQEMQPPRVEEVEEENTVIRPDIAGEHEEREATQEPEESDRLQPNLVGVEVAPPTRPREELEEAPTPLPTAATRIEEEEYMQPQPPSHGTQAEVGKEHPSTAASSPKTPTITSPPAAAAATPAAAGAAAVPEVPTGGYIAYAQNEVIVDATVYPMEFRVVVRAPGSPGGKIATRFVYESIASHLAVHPEVMKLFCDGKRIRFGETIDYEEGAPPDKGRLWVDVYFAEGKMPLHLHELRKDDLLNRCVQVRSRPDDVRPADLVEARRRGLTFDEAISEARLRSKNDNLVSVAIIHEPSGTRLPFLGGYRVKKDPSRVFLHASTQLRAPGDTALEDLQYGPLPRDGVSRRTQTYGVTRSCQTLRECHTQTARPDYEADEKYDEVVIAKTYFTSVQLIELQTEKTIVIQKMYRKWKARKIYRELFANRQDFLNRAAERAAADEAEKKRIEEFERKRRSIPCTADDFATLRRELEAWRAAEAARILSDSSLSEMAKRAALTDLTKKELRLLQELETLRRGAIGNRRTRRFEDILALMTSAKTCGVVSVTTQAAERARELRELYVALIETPTSVEARLDILLHVKWTVKEFDSALTQQIAELVDRESDLLQRGRTASSLKGLRTRLEHLFKRFIATPEYNPAVDEVVKGSTFGTFLDSEAAATLAAKRHLKPSNAV